MIAETNHIKLWILRRTVIVFIFLIIMPSHHLLSQEVIDVVYLKNGDILKGLIVEQIPFESIKMELLGGSTITIKYSDIARMVKEKVSTPKQPSLQNEPTVTNLSQDQSKPHQEKATFLSIGYGNSYGGFGLDLATITSSIVTLHVGGGYFPLSNLREGAKDMFLVSGGVRIFFEDFPKDSRSYIDFQFGMLGGEYNEFKLFQGGSLVSTTKDQQSLYGPSILFGREVFWGDGTFGGRIAGGGSYNLAKIDWQEIRFLWALDAGLIVRF